MGLVQEVGASSDSTAVASLALTIAAMGVGNCGVVFSTVNTSNLSAVVGGGVTWALLKLSGAVAWDVEIWYGLNSSGAGTTVTLTPTVSQRVSGIFLEFDGVPTSGADQGQTNHAGNVNSGTVAPGPVTPGSGPALILTANGHSVGGVQGALDSGFTNVTQRGASNPSLNGGWLIQPTPAAVNPTATMSPTADWEAIAAVLSLLPFTRAASGLMVPHRAAVQQASRW